jgi:hypothetical protein
MKQLYIPLETAMLVRVFHRTRRVRVADSNLTEECRQIKARKRASDLGRKRVRAMLVIVMATTPLIPQRMELAVGVRRAGVGAQRRSREWDGRS